MSTLSTIRIRISRLKKVSTLSGISLSIIIKKIFVNFVVLCESMRGDSVYLLLLSRMYLEDLGDSDSSRP